MRRVPAEPLQATPTTGLSALLVLFALLKVLTNSHVAIWKRRAGGFGRPTYEPSSFPSWETSRSMSLWKLIAADLCLGAAALFGIVLVTAPDHPTTTQGVIAWTLLAVLMILVVVPLVVGVRRIMRRRAGHDE